MSNLKALAIITLIVVAFGCQKSQSAVEDKPPQRLYQLWESITPDGLKAFQKVDFIYDEKERLTEQLTSRVVGDSMKWVRRERHLYNSEGNRHQLIRENWENDQWVFVMQSWYEFESKRVVLRKDSLLTPDGNTSFELGVYDYNDKGKEVSIIDQNVTENGNVNKMKMINIYDESMVLLGREFFSWSVEKQNWEYLRKMDLIYNEQGHHIRTTRYNWVNEKWEESLNYELEVNDEGIRLSELWQRPGENGRTDFWKISYGYVPR